MTGDTMAASGARAIQSGNDRAAFRRAICGLLVSGLVLGGCYDGTGPVLDEDRLLQTEAASYEWTVTGHGAQATIPYSFHNRTARTVYIGNCNGVFSIGLQRLVDGTWEDFWSPPVPLCASQPIEIPPATSFADTLSAFGAYPGSEIHPQFASDDLEGVYRIIWHGAYVEHELDIHSEHHTSLPLDSRLSNRFEIAVREPSPGGSG